MMIERRTDLNTAESIKFTAHRYLRWLNTASEGVGYESTVFEIKPTAPLNNFTHCDDCDNKGRFLIHEKDHLNNHSIFIYCEEHAPKPCFTMLSSANAA